MILLGFVLVVLTISYYNNALPQRDLLVSILVFTGIFFPAFCLILTFLIGLWTHTARRKLYSTEPFNQLDKIGFKETYKNLKSKWQLTEVVMAGSILDYIVIADFSKETSKMISFETNLEWKKLEKSEIDNLAIEFEKENIVLGIGTISKHYRITENNFTNIEELKADLERFIEKLNLLGFKPKKGCA